MASSFIHLSLHTEYSISDSLIRVDELIEKLIQLRMPAVAITDLNNLFAMIKFYQSAERNGIKPIIGSDVWLENPDHPELPFRIVLLCQNSKGYHALTLLLSKAYIERKIHGKPVIKQEWLFRESTGLLVIADMYESPMGRMLAVEDLENAKQCLLEWTNFFKDRFYLEVKRLGISNENQIIQKLVTLSEETACPLVATNAVCFLEAEDFEAHEARVCIHDGTLLDDQKRDRRYQSTQYLKSAQEMSELFSDLPEALENSVEIAKRCNLTLELGKVFLPNYPVPSGMTTESYLSNMATQALESRLHNVDAHKMELYRERLSSELSVINSMGFAGYFLIVADFIRWAMENGVPVGPGRGSGAGSLVAYVLHITNLDPIQYELLFERFLNPERVSMPDFDIDFCMEGRDRVIEYVSKTYGKQSVSQIITYGTMAAKAVIRDVGRVLGYPYGFVDKIAKLIPNELGITLQDALKREEVLQQYQSEEDVRTLMDLAKKLEGITRNVGKHAGGVVIAPTALTDFTPLYCEEEDGALVTQFDKDDIETIGLIKFDFLGLRTLTIIDWTVKTINQQREQNHQTALDITTIPLHDEKTFMLLKSCATTAIFQLESRGMKDLIRRLQPDNFEEIIALVALFRPGPLQSGMVDDFINRKHGRASIEYPHPKLVPVLQPTYGVILYQEQVMQIAQILAGYTLGGADLLRRAMGKKKPEEMAKQRAIFIAGAVERGIDGGKANYIFDLMEKFAGYGFNKSHSAAYAVLTYQTAWLKTHYPAAFMAAVLSSDMAHTDKVVVFLEECRSLGVIVHPPSVNASAYHFVVDGNKAIRYGLGAIKGMGEAAIAHLIAVREQGGEFKDLYDLCARIEVRKVSRRTLEALIRAGALDEFGMHRALLIATLDSALQMASQIEKDNTHGQLDLFSYSVQQPELLELPLPQISEWSNAQRLLAERETLGFYLTGHPIDEYATELSQVVTSSIKRLSVIKKSKQRIAGLVVAMRSHQTRRGDRMVFVMLDDKTGQQEIAIFSDLYKNKRHLIVKDQLLIVDGEVSHDPYSGGSKFRCLDLMDLEMLRIKTAKRMILGVRSDKVSSQFNLELAAILKPFCDKDGCSVMLEYQKDQGYAHVKLSDAWHVRLETKLLEAIQLISGVVTIQIVY